MLVNPMLSYLSYRTNSRSLRLFAVRPMKWLGSGEGDGIIKVEMDRGPHRTQDDAAVGYVFQRAPDPEFHQYGPKQLRWAHGDDSIIDVSIPNDFLFSLSPLSFYLEELFLTISQWEFLLTMTHTFVFRLCG